MYEYKAYINQKRVCIYIYMRAYTYYLHTLKLMSYYRRMLTLNIVAKAPQNASLCTQLHSYIHQQKVHIISYTIHHIHAYTLLTIFVYSILNAYIHSTCYTTYMLLIIRRHTLLNIYYTTLIALITHITYLRVDPDLHVYEHQVVPVSHRTRGRIAYTGLGRVLT